MNTLRIEHPVTDYAVWKQAFDRFAGLRESSGVVDHVVHRPVDDPRYVVIDLDFRTAEEAAQFLGILRSKVWSTPANSPALAGAPITRVLTTEEDSRAMA